PGPWEGPWETQRPLSEAPGHPLRGDPTQHERQLSKFHPAGLSEALSRRDSS
ncbi:Hypothetical predicted protein, partial [Podarcis lilfordi]